MKISWRRDDSRDEYYYDSTESRFSAQIGLSTIEGKYCWLIFHQDFRYDIDGGEVRSVGAAKRAANRWLTKNTKLE